MATEIANKKGSLTCTVKYLEKLFKTNVQDLMENYEDNNLQKLKC